MSLAEKYQELCDTPSDIWEHLPTFVDLVEFLDAKTVIELGTRTGVSTVAWLYGLEQTGGHLWSVDIDKRPDIGKHDNWTFIQGDDCSETVFSRLPAQADIVFIDTSHEYQHTLTELSLYHWLVRPGGRIVLHDTELPHPEGVTGKAYPVRRAVEEFCQAEGLSWSNNPNCWGLGVIEIPGELPND